MTPRAVPQRSLTTLTCSPIFTRDRSRAGANVVSDLTSNWGLQVANKTPFAQQSGQPQRPQQVVIQEQEEEMLHRYKRRLALQSEPQLPEEQEDQILKRVDESRQRSLGEVKLEFPSNAPIVGDFAAGRSGGGRLEFPPAAPAAAAPSPPPPVTGLASLDVDLPQSGQVYRFTTPRGEVEITAWAVSKRVTRRLLDLLPALLTLALLVAGIVLVRLQFWSVLIGRAGSTCLVCIGLVMVVLGIFPIVGSLAVVVGVIAKLARWIARLESRRRVAPP